MVMQAVSACRVEHDRSMIHPSGRAVPAAPAVRPAPIGRRDFLRQAGALVCSAAALAGHADAALATSDDLLTAPIHVIGDWGGSLPQAAEQVVRRMRRVCLDGVPLLSDQQPGEIRVDDHSSGQPAIWLHDEPADTAWIIVDIGTRAWCQLAYQFGHELGHVLCNSWRRAATPRPPCQWLEESLVEAFSIRGLALLAASWAQDPPFPGDNGYAAAITDYRQHLIERYRSAAASVAGEGLTAWFRAHRDEVEHHGGIGLEKAPAILHILDEYETETASLADLGALNRWPGRSGVPLDEYLSRWQASCAEIAAPGLLPRRLRDMLNPG